MRLYGRKTNKKSGFTIVELVIVIAVIAILAAVLIPTFSGTVNRARESSARQTALNTYKTYYATVKAQPDATVREGMVFVKDGFAFANIGGTVESLTEVGKRTLTEVSADDTWLMVGSWANSDSPERFFDVLYAVKTNVEYTFYTLTHGDKVYTFLVGENMDATETVGAKKSDITVYDAAMLVTDAAVNLYASEEAMKSALVKIVATGVTVSVSVDVAGGCVITAEEDFRAGVLVNGSASGSAVGPTRTVTFTADKLKAAGSSILISK